MVLAKNRFVAYALRLGFNDLYQYLWLRKGGPGAIPNPAANQRYKIQQVLSYTVFKYEI